MKDNYKERMTCPPGSFPYTIKSGDTLYKLANQYNTTVAAIMALNPNLDPNNLRVGQVICIPREAPPTPSCPNGFLYTIKSGDTIFKLSQQFGVPVESIIQANPGINPDKLQIGQVICIPTGSQPIPPTPDLPPCTNGVYYTIVAGDNLYSISQRFNVSVQEIIQANPGINPNNLQVGQVICIPRKCVVFCF